MADIWQQFGSDLTTSASGDLAVVEGAILGQQRVLRRLLTNPGDYIWQLDYGAGLASFVGAPIDVPRIRGLIRSQIFREAAVARSPEPEIEVLGGDAGEVFVSIVYTDASSGQTQLLSFAVGGA